MEIWLKGKKKIRIPVLPAEYTVSTSHNNSTVDINALGEMDLGGKKALTSISFSSFFPAHYDSDYCETRGIRSPSSYVKAVEKLMRAGTFRLLMTGTPVRMRVRLDSFEYSEKDGTGDIYYTVTFKEHRNMSASASSVVTLAEMDGATGENTDATLVTDKETTRTEPGTVSSSTYTVKAGDCLSTIARQLSGSADWKSIYEQNKDAIGANPNNISVGMTLTIPNARAET